MPQTAPSPLFRTLTAAWLALSALLLCAPLGAQAAEVSIPHAQGTTVLKGAPAKIITLDFAVLDTLDALGVPVLGVPSAVVVPPRLAHYQEDALNAGTLFEPDYEAIHAASPDLIIVSGRSAAKYGALRRIAPTVDLSPADADLIKNVEARTRLLADLFGKQQQAEAKLAAIHASIDELKALSADTGPALVILTTGGKMSAYGPGSRFGAIHDAFGFKPADDGLKVSLHGQAISFEYLVKTNPEWLFVVDRDAAIGQEGQSARRLLDNELVHKTTAWQKGQVVYLNTVNWYLLESAGLTALQENVEQLIEVLAQPAS